MNGIECLDLNSVSPGIRYIYIKEQSMAPLSVVIQLYPRDGVHIPYCILKRFILYTHTHTLLFIYIGHQIIGLDR